MTNETKTMYTKALLKEFDRLTERLSHRNQVVRIDARLNIKAFVEKHGKDVCDAMFEELKERDRKVG